MDVSEREFVTSQQKDEVTDQCSKQQVVDLKLKLHETSQHYSECLHYSKKLEQYVTELLEKGKTMEAAGNQLEHDFRLALDSINTLITERHPMIQVPKLKVAALAFSEEDDPLTIEEAAIEDSSVLTDLKTYYVTTCENEIRNKVKRDLLLLEKYNAQMDRIKTEMYQVELNVENLADAVSELVSKQSLDALKEIATIVSIPFDNTFIETFKQVCKKMAQFTEKCFQRNLVEWDFTSDIKELRDYFISHQINERDWLRQGTAWIQSMKRQFDSCNTILQNLQSLTPDIQTESKCVWKDQFIERYTALTHLIVGYQSMDALPEVLKTLQLPNGVQVYFDTSEKLRSQCRQIALYMNTPFQEDSFHTQVTSTLTKCKEEMNSCEAILQRLRETFDVIHVDGLRCKIISIIAATANAIVATIPEPTDLQTFQAVVEYYFGYVTEQLKQKMEDEWQTQYRLWLRELNLDESTATVNFVPFINRLKISEWETLYKQWLTVLGMKRHIPKEEFQEKLRQYREKREPSETYDVSQKKMKLDYRWSDVKSQNLFMAFYKEFFHLKWEYLRGNIPTDTVLRQTIEEKLTILKDLTASDPKNAIFKAYSQYVKMDLGLWAEQTQFFNEVTSTDTLLTKCMEETNKYLLELTAQ